MCSSDLSSTLTSSLPLFRYEDEINKRAAVENEFVLLKKVSVKLEEPSYNLNLL